MAASLLLTSGPVRFEALLHSCGQGGGVLTCGSAHSWQLNSAASLGHQAAGTMTCYSLSVSLSWHWANQSLPYLNNAEHWARKQQVSILKSLVRFDQCQKTARSRLEPATFGFPNLSEREAGALLIRPPRLVPEMLATRPVYPATDTGL